MLALLDGVRSDLDADGGEHGLQSEQHDVRFGWGELVIEHRHGDLADGGGDLGRGQGRGEVDDGIRGGFFLEDSVAVGGDAEPPQEDFGE